MSEFFDHGILPGLKLMFAIAYVKMLPKKYQNKILTLEEKQSFHRQMDAWGKYPLQTGVIDQNRARKSIENFYKTAGFKPPQHIIFLEDSDQRERVLKVLPLQTDVEENERFYERLMPFASMASFLVRKFGIEFPEVNDIDGGFGGGSFTLPPASESVLHGTERVLAKQYSEELWYDLSNFSAGRYLNGLAFCAFSNDIGVKMPRRNRRHFQALKQMVQECGLFFLAGKDVVLVAGRPREIVLNQAGQLHNEKGAALILSNGQAVYAFKGIAVPKMVVTEPDKIDFAYIVNISNLEIRRVMIEMMGAERFLAISDAQKIDEGKSGILWRVLMTPEKYHLGEGGESWSEPSDIWQAVQVQNSSAEPDGSYKSYFLQVPPAINTAHQAVAWTFGMSGEEYNPTVES